MMLDIEILRFIWWILIGVLFIGFAVTDGFDLGAATIFPFVARNETERRLVLSAIGPFWEGNQVWIILGAGALFAAWPFVYAVAFSGAYFVVLLLLLTMGISRPVSFKYRSKLPSITWRRFWDWSVFVGGIFPALLFGILVGNILVGLPFKLDTDLRVYYTGTFSQLFHPFALFCALTSLCMLVMHGGLYLAVKTSGAIRIRAINWAQAASISLILFFILGGVWVSYYLVGYEVISEINPAGFSNPLHKTVAVKTGAWLANYAKYPLVQLCPLLGIVGALLAYLTARMGNSQWAFVFSGFSITGIISTVGVSMFPFILPSSLHFASSLLVWDASSSQLTLLLMLIAAMIFLPLILLYTTWVYRMLRGKVHEDMLGNENSVY